MQEKENSSKHSSPYLIEHKLLEIDTSVISFFDNSKDISFSNKAQICPYFYDLEDSVKTALEEFNFESSRSPLNENSKDNSTYNLFINNEYQVHHFHDISKFNKFICTLNEKLRNFKSLYEKQVQKLNEEFFYLEKERSLRVNSFARPQS